jgi:hypothetical protein
VALRCKVAAKMVRSTARLHRNHAWRQDLGERHDVLRPYPAPLYHCPRRIRPRKAAAVLTKVDPQDRDSIRHPAYALSSADFLPAVLA